MSRALHTMVGMGLACALVVGCERNQEPQPETTTQQIRPTPQPAQAKSAPQTEGQVMREDPGAEDSPPVKQAIAVLSPTKGSQVTGTVTFTQADQGLEVEAEVQGLPQGAHAYHVHLYGDCSSEDAKSAGTHMNFEGPSKNPPQDINRITGNLGELTADSSGKASAKSTIEKASLKVPFSIIGRAVIVHEKGNDEASPPIGAAGGRLACGVIGVKES